MTETTEQTWRRLALQFDEHRMQAISLLKHARDSGLQNREAIDAFLSAPPPDGEAVLAERITAMQPTPQWQPIETAPKDGSWILLYECEGVYDTPDFTHWIASWRWTEDSCGWLDQDENIVVSNPSHWMPLPVAPQEGVRNCPGYSPDIQAMGDCRHCGHTAEAHDPPATPQQAAKVLPDSVMVWHSSHTLDHLGTWSTTRYPEYAKEYVPRAKFDRMQQASQLGLDMAKANDLWNTAETISRAISSEDSK